MKDKKEIAWNWLWGTVGLLLIGSVAWIPFGIVFLVIISAAVGLGFTTWEWGSDDGNALMVMER